MRLLAKIGVAHKVYDDAELLLAGVLAIWSATKDYAFAARLKKTGFDVEEVQVRARSNGKGAKHTIWFAARPA